jgi:hypothetical protein
MIDKNYDWQGWIDSFDTDETGRIIITEEEERAHMMKMREVNKGWKHEFTKEYITSLPKDENGYIIITPESEAIVAKEMVWVSENYPNCRYLPFKEQSKIGDLAREAVKNEKEKND